MKRWLAARLLAAATARAAWDSWELVRRLAPRHGMAGDIDKREAALQQLYPEYF